MLFPNKLFHIYNHANGTDNLFTTDANYFFFLQKILKYIVPICDVYAYCLLPNHFHLFVRVKMKAEAITFYENYLQSNNLDPTERMDVQDRISKIIHLDIDGNSDLQYQKYISKQFSNLFSSYTQSFNKVYNRRGSLFLKNFKSKEVDSAKYLASIVQYIHYNPVKHQLVSKVEHWKWSSYQYFVSNHQSFVLKDKVLAYFGSADEFILAHSRRCIFDGGNEFEYF